MASCPSRHDSFDLQHPCIRERARESSYIWNPEEPSSRGEITGAFPSLAQKVRGQRIFLGSRGIGS